MRYRYTADRRGEHPRAHLTGFGGVLQADGYAGFNGLYDTGRVAEAACWAHVRRKFHDIHAAGNSPIALEALTRIAALYAIEAPITGKPPDLRRYTRQTEAAPLLDGLRSWLDITLTKVPGRSDVAGAIRYALSRWTALTRWLHGADLPATSEDQEPCRRPRLSGPRSFSLSTQSRTICNVTPPMAAASVRVAPS